MGILRVGMYELDTSHPSERKFKFVQYKHRARLSLRGDNHKNGVVSFKNLLKNH
jgi:hypothetical protein